MSTLGPRVRKYRTLIMLLSLIWIVTALTIASCGSGGSSNGELCDTCGGDNGSCRGQDGVRPLPLPADHPLCPQDLVPDPAATCLVTLSCVRKLDGGRRCFPIEADPQFRCDGERPDLDDFLCGNGMLDSGEVCDPTAPNQDDEECLDNCTRPPTVTVTPAATATPVVTSATP